MKQGKFRRNLQRLVSFCGVMALPFFLLMAGCAKDYSYEQQLERRDTIVATTPVPAAAIAACSACSAATLPASSWRLDFEGVVYCGVVERAVLNPEQTGFTFFGPSFCSSDSGFVASVYLENDTLNSDKTDVRARLGCYYYSNTGQPYFFMSSPAQPLQLTITSYVHQTRTGTGTFRGFVATGNGPVGEVKNGRFHFRF